MTDETPSDAVNTEEDGGRVAKEETKNEIETKEATNQPKQRSVSFNRDVHVKRFGKPRESRGTSTEHQPTQVHKEPFTHLSETELIAEANKVLAQAESVTCTADHPPEKFYSLPHRRKFKQEQDKTTARRNSDDSSPPDGKKTPLGRSTSDVSAKKRGRERTSLSTLFRRAQRNKSPDEPVIVATKPIAVVKRSKSDVSDLKSNTKLITHPKPIRKRSGSETEEFLKSLRNKKSQLSPIIESSPREDYFKKTSPLEHYQKQNLTQKNCNKSDELTKSSDDTKKINPIEKPPRYKTPERQSGDPKAPTRTKRGKSLEKENKEQSPTITETPKRKTDIKKTLLVDEIDNIRGKDNNPIEVKDRIKDSIKKIQENVYADKDMIHSSQQPPDKPPLTRGHTVDHIVRILKEDQFSPSPKAHLISPLYNGSNNQPFSYTKPSVSPDPNLYIRTTSPDRIPTPVNKMNNDKGVVYAQVVRGENGDNRSNNMGKQTVHKTYSPSREKYGNLSDEDEGLGHEDQRNKFSPTVKYDYNKNKENNNFSSLQHYKVTDSPIRPRFREYKLTSFDDFEPTYANQYSTKEDRSRDFIDTTFRGRADGMDSKRKAFIEPEPIKTDLNFNELSHRRQRLESRLNARRYDRERVNPGETVVRYTETDPIYEAEKRMKATEKYVNETAKYYHHTLERDGYTENSVSESYSKYDNDEHNIKYNTEKRIYEKVPRGELDRREFINRLQTNNIDHFQDKRKVFPPEPEYEPPSLEFPTKKPILTPDEYKEKKYRVKSHLLTSSHDTLQTGQKYSKGKDHWLEKRKGHYVSNPEIAQKREEDYVNANYDPKHRESYHSSLKREKKRDQMDKYYKDYRVRRHDSGDSRDYVYQGDRSPRRFDIDNRLVDSGIENDFRKDSSGEIHRTNGKYKGHESDDDVRDTSLFLASERRHTEDNYPSEQIYANGEYVTKFVDYRYPRKEYVPRERSADDGSHFDPRIDGFDKSPSRNDENISAKPPKAVKKLSGLEKVKQLFSRDSSKKSKKEKEVVQNKSRTRVLKSPEHLARHDSDYRRYKDPEPSDEDIRRRKYDPKGSDSERRYRSSDPADSDIEKKYKSNGNGDPNEIKRRHYKDTKLEDRIRYEKEIRVERDERGYTGSSDRESEHRTPRTSDVEFQSKSRETSRKQRSMTADSLDSPALAERYRERRRLATPSPSPSPPRAQPIPPPPTSAGNWFKSLDRLTRKRSKNSKVQKESSATAEDESIIRKNWKTKQSSNSPAKNLRFFGDTDQDSDVNTAKHGTVTKSKSHPQSKHSTLRKTTSNSSTGIDELDQSEMSNKSYSLSNLHKEVKTTESPRSKPYYKRNLHNISEIQSNSENESGFDRKFGKPPISPYDRRSRSHSSSKNVGNKDIRKHGSRTELRSEERGSSSELRGSKQELSRDLKHRRRTPAPNSGESSTEGESSHQSQRSVVYLHATTVGDIPDPGRMGKNRSRDDVSSVNSSQVQVRTSAKSFSIFAPWTPRHYNDQRDVNYAQKPRQKTKTKEPPKSSSTRNLTEDRPSTLQKNKSYSQTTLTRRPQNHRLTSSSTTLYRKPEKRSSKENLSKSTLSRSKNVKDSKISQSTEVLQRDGEKERISRSISMPRDNNKKAGWFKLTNKNKKPDINTRVR